MVADLAGVVLGAWHSVARLVAAGQGRDFVGRDKETRVFRKVREEIERIAPNVQVAGPDLQVRFGRWGIDLVCGVKGLRLAAEGKYKVRSDGAVPDNRKAVFFDLFKLEQYVDSGEYATGLFLWLTDEAAYRQQATGDSADFSTHQGRIYEPGTALRAARSRNPMPLPLVLSRRYRFDWEAIDSTGCWYTLVLQVD